MIGLASDLVPGNLYRAKSGGIYVYLGYYWGRPRSMYSRPYQGYLYMFHSSGRPPTDADDVRRGIIGRIALNDIDGNACYTVHPKPFAAYAGHVDLSPIWPRIQTPYGLDRLGDRRPKKA